MINWRARRGRSTVCGGGLGSCFWLRTAWRAGRLDVQSDARPARTRSGGSYAEKRLAGLDETGDRGAEPKYTAETNKRILALLDQVPPKGYARWTGPLLAAALGDVDIQHIWRFLRAQKIDLAGRKSWCESNDPEFVAKAADVVGLYMAPSENAIVICVDEKPSIQALERAQGYLKLPNGRALTGHSHDYKCNGTTTLFTAFEVASGKKTPASNSSTKTVAGQASRLRKRSPRKGTTSG